MLFLPGLSAKAAMDPDCAKYYSKYEIDKNTNLAEGLPQYCTAGKLATTVINVILALAGSALVLFIIVGGFLLITAGGNEEQSEKGKKVMTNAVLGMVVVIMAFAIVKIIANTLTGNTGTGNNTTNTPSATNPTPSNPSPGPTTPSGPSAQEIAAAKGRLAGRISFVSNSNLNMWEIFADFNKQAYADDIKKVCGVTDIGGNVAISVTNKNGQQVGTLTTLTVNTTSYNATIRVPKSQAPSGDVLIVKMCEQEITGKQF